MLQKTDIANLALGRLGVSLNIAVTDFDTDNSAQAKIIRRMYQMSLDTLLQKHEWKFATYFQGLNLLETDENFGFMGFKYKYEAPADAMVIREIASGGIFTNLNLYEVQKAKFQTIYSSSSIKIVTNIDDAHARYTVRIPVDNQVPVYFGRALSAQLAWDIAPMLITNNFPKIRDSLARDLADEITLGMAQDEGTQPQMDNAPNPFVMSRFQ